MQHLIAVGTFVQGHILSILLAFVFSFIIGFVWHGPLFGKQWMAYNKITPPKPEDVKFTMMLPGIAANFVMVFVQSAVIGRALEILTLTSVVDALIIGLIFWLPFTALVIVNAYTWEGKKIGHMCLSAGYELVITLMISATMYYTL